MVKVNDIYRIEEEKVQKFDQISIPNKDIGQKIKSETRMIPYIFSANYHRMKSNKFLNFVSPIFLICGLLSSFSGFTYPLISSVLIIIRSIGLSLSMSALYNS